MKIRFKITTEKINFWLITIFGIVIMLDPANNYRLKIPMFVLALMGCMLTMNKTVNKLCTVFIAIVVLYTVYGILVCNMGERNIASDYQMAHIQLVFMSLLIIPLSRFSMNEVLKMNYIVGLVLATVINSLFMASAFSPDIALSIYRTNMEDQSIPTIIISRREFLGITVAAFFYKTAPYLFFASLYQFCRAKSVIEYLIAVFLIFPIFITGSRTPILCGMCILFYRFITTRKLSARFKVFITGIVVFIGTVLIYFLAIDNSDNSAAIKGGNILTYINDILTPQGFLTGRGIGSEFMDIRGHLASHSEVSYFDILRMWGLVFGSIYIFFLLYPITAFFKSKNKDIRTYMFAYFLYMVLAGTNPFIFASTGWFIILTAYCVLIKSKIGSTSHFLQNNEYNGLSLHGHI